MQNFKDLSKTLDIGISYVRQLAGFVYPGVKLFTDEQVQRLIEIRAEMKTGQKLSWEQVKEKYGVKEKQTETEEQPSSQSLDNLAKQTIEESLPELQEEIDNVVGGQIIAPMVVKSVTKSMESVPYLVVGAALYSVKRNKQLMSASLTQVKNLIDSQPHGNFKPMVETVANLIDSAYEQGRRITGAAQGDFEALEAAKEKDQQ